jgi:hypothetical protein
MKLTDVEIPLDKLYEYCLNPEHPRGGYKAILFEQTLGISRKNASRGLPLRFMNWSFFVFWSLDIGA